MTTTTQRYKNDGRLETIRFKGDAATRRRFFTPESFQHPAKMASGLVLECLERYTRPGDWVLDPMAGSGTLLLGAMYGRNLILNEMELHFVLPMLKSWAKIQRNGPALGHAMGEAVILRGDARCLPLPDASVGAAITSPPYEGSIQGEPGIDWTRCEGGTRDRTKEPAFESVKATLSGYTRPVDAIVTSPPYESAGWKADENPDNVQQREDKRRLLYPMRPPLPGRYTRPVDAIISSPPYQNRDDAGAIRDGPGFGPYTNSDHPEYWHTQRNQTNIGNLRSAAYWEAMRQVYAECWRVLRPRGIMALVLKGFTRDGQYVDLPGQTEALLVEGGWQKHDHWRRELWSLSFWRILQRRRDPAAFDERLKYEEVRAFRKVTQ